MGTDLVVLWLAREGSYIREAKDARRCVDWLLEALDKMLASLDDPKNVYRSVLSALRKEVA